MTGEGVETAGELAVLARVGCDLVQGYAFAAPMETAAFEAWRLAAEVRGASSAMPDKALAL